MQTQIDTHLVDEHALLPSVVGSLPRWPLRLLTEKQRSLSTLLLVVLLHGARVRFVSTLKISLQL